MISLDEFMCQKPLVWGKMTGCDYAPDLLSYLLWCAINSSLMTYGALAKNVHIPRSYRHGSAMSIATGSLAGYIGDYCVDNELPPLNALVVNKRNFLPSIGVTPYLRRYGIINYDEMGIDEKQRALSDTLYPLIFQPGIWINLLEVYGIKPKEPKYKIPYKINNQFFRCEEIAKIIPPDLPYHGGMGEGEAHRALKMYVVENCETIENLRLLGCSTDNADMEHLLPSMDRPDILFQNGNLNVACEIKSWRSDEADLYRGIFQCVKYKALLNAMDVVFEARTTVSECILVIQRKLPENLQQMANCLRIPLVRLSRKMVRN